MAHDDFATIIHASIHFLSGYTHDQSPAHHGAYTFKKPPVTLTVTPTGRF